MTGKCAIELSWNEVSSIVSDEVEKVLGIRVLCRAIISEGTHWDIAFIGYRLPLPNLFQLVQAIQATMVDLEDTMSGEVGTDVNGIGMTLAEKLVARHLRLTWEHQLITEGSLWLVDVATDGRTSGR